jgi:hypothetical protein
MTKIIACHPRSEATPDLVFMTEGGAEINRADQDK